MFYEIAAINDYYNSTVIRAGIYLLSAIMKWHEMEWNGMNYGREGIWTAIITPCHQLILIHPIIKENVFSFNDEMNRIAEWPTTRKTQSISWIFLKLMRFFLKWINYL